PMVGHEIALDLLKAKGIDEEKAMKDKSVAAEVAAAEKTGELKLKKIDDKEYQTLLARAEAKEAHERLIYQMIDPQLRKMGLNPSYQRIEPEQYESARKEVIKQIDAMTPDQRKSELAKLDAKAKEEMDANVRSQHVAARGQYSGAEEDFYTHREP